MRLEAGDWGRRGRMIRHTRLPQASVTKAPWPQRLEGSGNQRNTTRVWGGARFRPPTVPERANHAGARDRERAKNSSEKILFNSSSRASMRTLQVSITVIARRGPFVEGSGGTRPIRADGYRRIRFAGPPPKRFCASSAKPAAVGSGSSLVPTGCNRSAWRNDSIEEPHQIRDTR